LLTQETEIVKKSILSGKITDYSLFAKLRLAGLVVISAVIVFALGKNEFDLLGMITLAVGGFLVTGSSNGFNQIMEVETDKLMTRTSNRPLVTDRMSEFEAVFIALLMGATGIFLLYYFHNWQSAVLSLIALLSYTLIYTPLKKITPFAVFVGAFPGAIPPLLGWVAATGTFSVEGWIFFAIQFIWQFPHFWAIAWVINDDYLKAGFKMLPSVGGRDKSSAFQILIYTLGLIPISLFPVLFNISGLISAVVIILSGVLFAFYAYKLYNSLKTEDATKLMFASFVYIPVVFLAILMDRL
jgi:heme o synthase